jgi:hypothetical protein
MIIQPAAAEISLLSGSKLKPPKSLVFGKFAGEVSENTDFVQYTSRAEIATWVISGWITTQ